MRICQLVTKSTWEQKLCRARFDALDAVARKPGVTFVRTGPGWHGWDPAISAEANLMKICGKIPDVVQVYQPHGIKGLAELNTAKVLIMNEVHLTRFIRDLDACRPQLVIFHHSCELERDGGKICRARGIRTEYIPHCYNPEHFQPLPTGTERTIDFLLVGDQINGIYPLRSRFRMAMRKLTSEGYRCRVHAHPGYSPPDAYTGRYQREMGQAVASAKITMFCSSIYRYRLQKYSEVPACASLPLADMPDDQTPYQGLVATARDPVEKLCRDYLAAWSESQAHGARKAVEHLTTDWYADRFLNAISWHLGP